jgi:hypothetical protein
MIIIRFPDHENERSALGYLAGRFSFKTWSNGELMLPEQALPHLAVKGIRFIVEGPAKYEHFSPLRDSHPVAV